MKGSAWELKVNEWQMNAWTSWPCDTVRNIVGEVWRMIGMPKALNVKVASLNLIRLSVGSRCKSYLLLLSLLLSSFERNGMFCGQRAE